MNLVFMDKIGRDRSAPLGRRHPPRGPGRARRFRARRGPLPALSGPPADRDQQASDPPRGRGQSPRTIWPRARSMPDALYAQLLGLRRFDAGSLLQSPGRSRAHRRRRRRRSRQARARRQERAPRLQDGAARARRFDHRRSWTVWPSTTASTSIAICCSWAAFSTTSASSGSSTTTA